MDPRGSSSRLRAAAFAAIVALAPALAAVASAQEDPPKRSRLQGRAFLDRNTRVTGCTVQLRADDDPSRLYLTSADDAGHFRIDDLPDGDYSFVVRRSGYQPVLKEAVSLRFPFRAVVDVPMQLGADAPQPFQVGEGEGASQVRVFGRVDARDQGPLEDVRVRMLHPDGDLDPHLRETGADGRFAIDDLQPGHWIVEVKSVGYLTMRDAVHVTGDLELDLSMVAQPADYTMSPLELIPLEEIAPPDGLLPEPVRPAAPADPEANGEEGSVDETIDTAAPASRPADPAQDN